MNAVQQNKIDRSYLASILAEAMGKIDAASTLHVLLHEIKPLYLGKNSAMSQLALRIKAEQDPSSKKEMGTQLNWLRNAITDAINQRVVTLQELGLTSRLEGQKIDGTIPSLRHIMGKIHPITATISQIVNICREYGFHINEGPEIETDAYNFTALNMPETHPARQMHDTFYLMGYQNAQNDKYLLRTHTTTIDIRELITRGAPLYSMAYGKTFRYDTDRTHSPMFHQFEMLAVDKHLSMAHLKTYIIRLLERFFEVDNVVIRLRPSFFPFTEPSAEVDIGYRYDGNKIVIDEKYEHFMEIMGCGMLHPNVLRYCNIDEKNNTSIALGAGIERLAMLKYGITDIREFYGSNMQWLSHYGFSNLDI